MHVAAVVLLLGFASVCSALVNSVADLYNALQTSSNKKVGFVTEANFLAVSKVLPSSVVAIYPYSSAAALERDVANGNLFAGFISGDVPSGSFNYFSSRIISAQGMFTLGTPKLLKVLNAAIAQVQSAGTPQTLIRKYPGKLFTEVDSCSTAANANPFPSLSELDNSGEAWWSGCINGGNGCSIRIGTPYAKFDWFYDYTATPPTGWYADYAAAISDAIVAQYASRGFQGFHRVTTDPSKTTSTAVLLQLAAATAPFDATDFFFYTLTFTGTVAQTGQTYTGASRTSVFSSTCVVLGADGTFFTPVELNQNAGPVLSAGAIAGIVVGGVAGLAACVFAGVMIARERAGRPMFSKLVDLDDEAAAAIPKQSAATTGVALTVFSSSNEAEN